MEKKIRKIVKGKAENENGNFLPEKSIFHAGKKIGKSDFAPSEKYSFYAATVQRFYCVMHPKC